MATLMAEEATESLVARAQKGDRKAFDALISRYERRLQALVRSRCGRQARQVVSYEDLVQDMFLRAYRSLDRFAWKGEESFVRWLFTIAEHLIWNATQKRPRSVLALDDCPDSKAPSPERSLRREERFSRLEAALAGLSADQKEAVSLVRLEGLKVTEAAERMGRSPAAVKMLLSRALRHLRATFGDTESLHLPDRRLNLESGHGTQ